MNEPHDPQQPDDFAEEPTPPDPPQTQEIRHSPVSALVPDHVKRGVFSTGVVILKGPHEFVLDFLLRLASPHQLVARVVLPVTVVPRFIAALQQNIQLYQSRFGEIVTPQLKPTTPVQQSEPVEQIPGTTQVTTADEPTIPKEPGFTPAPASQQNSAEELYEQLKYPDEILAGVYANAVMIGHSATEFSFDFITTFFPRSVVSCRVFLAAPNTPRLLESLTQSYQQYQQALAKQQEPPPPPESKE